MKKNIKNTTKQGWITLLSLIIIAIAVSIGFTPLFELIKGGIAGAFIGASFAAIFVIVLTMFLLNKQTEIEQESKKSERVFDEKVKIYQEILDKIRDMLMDEELSKEDINMVFFPLIRLQMLADDSVIESFQKVFDKLHEIYRESEEDDVLINSTDKYALYELLSKFSSACRKDLELSDGEIRSEIIADTTETITKTDTDKRQKDLSKRSFNGVQYSKNRYIHAVLRDYLKENPNTTSEDFEDIMPRNFMGRKNTYETWKTYDEAIKHYSQNTRHKRFFITDKGKGEDYLKEKELVLQLVDVEICISSQWNATQTDTFVDLMKSKGIKTK